MKSQETDRALNAAPERRRAVECSSPAAGSAWPTDDEMMDEIEDMERCICDRCGGEGWIDYLDGDGSDWGEDCPSEENHPITCRQCNGTGQLR